jgi:hypothetical protein
VSHFLAKILLTLTPSRVAPVIPWAATARAVNVVKSAAIPTEHRYPSKVPLAPLHSPPCFLTNRMSKVSTATGKTPTQLPSQSTWARGPPQSSSSSAPSPRSQSPAPPNRMSKISTATGKTPTQLPSQSAWARGPSQSNSSSAPSPQSQSPAPPHAAAIAISHSRRPSALGQGVSVKDGVNVPRNNGGSVRPGLISSHYQHDQRNANRLVYFQDPLFLGQ